jgi:protein-S-isoprenylcysteine O-methyltransferase Ste14
MYASALAMLIGMSIALGSFFCLLVFAAISGVVIWRLLEEERFLAANLPGYTEYQKRGPKRLLPGVW